ncbi:MAG TPA: autotransporter domain-containing protein [Xanthobacteraceae bacterium]|nr:autotransporter domain-containing protein [Xanthobacteraceae bacterium]
MASSSAIAQNCGGFTSPTITNLPSVAGNNAVAVSTIAANISTVNTAFLLQSSAFVSAPGNPTPWQDGGGTWVRGVGGKVDVKNGSTGTANVAVPGAAPPISEAQPGNCNVSISQTFAGVQVGRDIAKLNVNGWNLHFGTTAGYLEADTDASGVAFKTNVQVPFAGIYGAATYGRFFADLLIRGDYYQTQINSPQFNFFGQNLNAHGLSIAGSAGYNFALQNNWFIEPSIGVVHTNVKVDNINIVGVGGITPIAGTISVNDIESTIGRLGVRVGTVVNYNSWILQPFASVSVWHDFSNDVTANFVACCATSFTPAVQPAPNLPASISQSFSGQNIGTYGQYSLGLSGQLADTGWLGFVRVDYRNGDRIEGLSGTGGIRYQFTPEMLAAPIVGKASKGPALVAPVALAPNWGGFYVGAFLGAAYGQAHWGISGFGSVDPHAGGVIGGGQAGYNWVAGPYTFGMLSGQYVYGIEGDIGATNLKGAQACGPLTGTFTTAGVLFNTTCNVSADWLATLTGRFGITWGRSLLYVKGGAAWTDAEYTLTCNNGPLNGTLGISNCFNPAGALVNTSTASHSHTGYTVGFGGEFALTPQWAAKAEYTFTDFGDKSATGSDGTPYNLGLYINQVKVGLNYRFSAR